VAHRRRFASREGSPIRVGLIQGNVEQKEKWDPRQARRIFTTYIAMTRDAVKRGAQYVIWPESSTPFMFEEDAAGQAIRDLAREVQVPIQFGSDQMARLPAKRRRADAASLQRRLPDRPDGSTGAVYRKMQLVPFGEFIPLQHWISFLSPLVGGLATFAAGESVTMLPVAGHQVSTAICYEVIFPRLAREAGRSRQRAAHHHHQRRLVRHHLGAVSALRAGVDARHRAGALPRARRQHRHQRRGGPVWAGGGEVGYL
jgi:apolipoprotein N-acyltransferase